MDLSIPKDLVQYSRAASAIATDVENANARYGPMATHESRLELLSRLDDFGLFDLEVGESPDDLLVAGTILRTLGRTGVGLPLAGLVVGHAAGLGGTLCAIGSPNGPVLVDGVDLGQPTFAIDMSGVRWDASPGAPVRGDRPLARFAAPAQLTNPTATDTRWWALHEVLAGFLALGVIEQAVDLSRQHLNEREQFGRPLKNFQALAHRFADMIVRREGLTELCLHTAWRHHARPGTSLVDALMLRLYALDSLAEITRAAHQIHASMGFCHDYPLADLTASTWLMRAQPLTASQVAAALAARADEIEMLFSDEPARSTS